ncbi:DUF4489 domain-containing protein [Vallitalea okinawensis]|uniref:DUF4489 domain-containing protein n=1 Tax=Vallitalea okinawensis TaxID=2078660 RepID=UPI000CFC6230|nr:DUF4489 domain-containing protein [Vallitalea okinawensis]
MSDYKEMERDYDSDRGRDCRDCVRCRRPGHPLPKPILFECGTGSGFSMSDGGPTTIACLANTERALGTVVLDTTCLCQPKCMIQFSSNVHFVPDNGSGEVELLFQLFRSCDGGQELQLDSWTFKIDDEGDIFSQTFSFFYCDCNSCPGCCTYSIRCKPCVVDDCSICVNDCHIAGFAREGCS